MVENNENPTHAYVGCEVLPHRQNINIKLGLT